APAARRVAGRSAHCQESVSIERWLGGRRSGGLRGAPTSATGRALRTLGIPRRRSGKRPAPREERRRRIPAPRAFVRPPARGCSRVPLQGRQRRPRFASVLVAAEPLAVGSHGDLPVLISNRELDLVEHLAGLLIPLDV